MSRCQPIIKTPSPDNHDVTFCCATTEYTMARPSLPKKKRETHEKIAFLTPHEIREKPPEKMKILIFRSNFFISSACIF